MSTPALNTVPFSGPQFMVIGVQKGGTTWLFHTLKRIPQLCGSNEKETRFFYSRWNTQKDNMSAEALRNRYHAHWPDPGDRLCFEASPGYIAHKEAAERVHTCYPHMRFVAVLRNPVTRAFSVFNMWSRAGAVRGTFRDFYAPILDELLELREKSDSDIDWYDTARKQRPRVALSRGLYRFQLPNWFKHYPKEDFLFLTTPKLRQMDTFRQLLIHVGGNPAWIDTSHLDLEIDNRHTGSKMSDADYDTLESFYSEHNQALFELLGVTDLDW